MTRIYAQPSNGRRRILALAALFAVFVAFAGGVILRPSGTAYAKAPEPGEPIIHLGPAPTGTIIVKKVGNTAGSGFNGVVEGLTDPSFSTTWGPIAVGGHSTVTDLPAAANGTQYRVSEDGPLGIGWTLVGYKELPQGATIESSCPANNLSGDYTNAATGASTTVYQSGAGNVRVVCVLNYYATPPVPVDSPAYIMVRKLRDPQGGPADATTFGGSITGPTNTTWGPIGVGSETALMPVSPGDYTVEEDQLFPAWQLVGYQLLPSTRENCSNDDADYAMSQAGDVSFSLDAGQLKVVCVMNVRRTIQIGWTLTICKVVDDNGDATDDGGLFKIDLTWNQQVQTTVNLTVHESDGPQGKCEDVHPPFDIIAKAKEQAFRPNSWNGDVAGYPKVKVDNGAIVSGDEAMVTSGPNHTITFYNKTQPRPRTGSITVTKRTLLNGLNNPFDDGAWHIKVQSLQCQYTQTKDTVQGNPVGTVVFTNLPICNDYVVTEDVNSKPLYAPVGPSSFNGVTPSGSAHVDFVNNREFRLPCIFGCEPDTTPTPTSTPTDTPPAGTPTATSTPTTPSATPTDVVQGQKTPGPQNTPIPPSTGTGVGSIVGGHSMVATFGLLGLVIGMVAFAGAALAMRKRS